ncbi:MAG TPA: hypothetical protein VMT54_00660 [Candidatus Cybelea sp.]|nr:hypothetical protein [Candidatus Cybelea sp.]
MVRTVSRENPDIYMCGWRLRTGLPLPGALLWPDPGTGSLDFAFEPGPVPIGLKHPVLDLEVLQITARGTALVRFQGIGRFLIQQRRITCDLEIGRNAPELTAVITGNVAACIAWRRGQLALHGSAVAIDGGAVLLLGRADTGKSLLAAALALRGHCALSDEVAAVRRGHCFPTGSMLSLADDALDALGIPRRGLAQYRRWRLPKRLWRTGPAAEPRPYPIAAVLVLRKGEPDRPNGLRRLKGDDAAEAIIDQVYRRGMLEILDSGRTARREAKAVAAKIPVFRFAVSRRLDRIGDAAGRIEALLR